jgi:hypothetical protein
MDEVVPMSEPIFQNWTSEVTARWGKAPLRLKHRLHEHPLFAFDALEQLIESYPREHYALVHMGAQGSPKRSWREGEIGKLSGKQVIEAIRNGRMWLNLRNVGSVDARYRDLLEQAFGEVDSNVGGYPTYNRTSGILISSPNAQVYYHADLPGQSLWQIHGRKRVYVYPNSAPFITSEQLENIALYEVEVDMRYEQAFDRDASVFEIGGGEMLHWPLNAPHRVENLDSLNVSMTTEYWTESIRRKQMINVANGLLRQKLGFRPKSRAIEGPAFWAKAALQAGVKRAGLLKMARRSRRPVVFRLDPKQPGAIIELAVAAE